LNSLLERGRIQNIQSSHSSDIHSLAELLSKDSIKQQKYRKVQFSAPELAYQGFQRLLDNTVTRAFNAELRQSGDTMHDVDDEDDGEDGEIITFQTTDEIVSISFDTVDTRSILTLLLKPRDDLYNFTG
jgi:hypothetical protein